MGWLWQLRRAASPYIDSHSPRQPVWTRTKRSRLSTPSEWSIEAVWNSRGDLQISKLCSTPCLEMQIEDPKFFSYSFEAKMIERVSFHLHVEQQDLITSVWSGAYGPLRQCCSSFNSVHRLNRPEDFALISWSQSQLCRYVCRCSAFARTLGRELASQNRLTWCKEIYLRKCHAIEISWKTTEEGERCRVCLMNCVIYSF